MSKGFRASRVRKELSDLDARILESRLEARRLVQVRAFTLRSRIFGRRCACVSYWKVVFLPVQSYC